MTLRRSALIVLLPLLAAAAGLLRAAEPAPAPVPEEAINRIERETGGRVLSVQRFQRGGRDVNRIKVYTPEGRVRVMWDYNGRATRAETPRRSDQLLVPSPPRYEREPRPAVGYERETAPTLRQERELPRNRDEH